MKLKKRLFMDECGYTGEDLFNEDQPVFVLSSIYLPEEYCVELKKEYFSKIQAFELKHSRLSKYPAQQKMVIDFIRFMSKQPNTVKFAVAHKRYVLITKIVDVLIEPMAYDDGIDFYKDGLNIAFSNMMYYLAKDLGGKNFFESMLLNFQLMMRERTYKKYEAFFKLFFKKHKKALDEFFVFLKAHHVRYGFDIMKTIPIHSLEFAFAEAFILVANWSEVIRANFIITHDESSEMAKKKEEWDKVVHPDVPPAVVGYDRRKMCFPIRAEKTEFARSQDYVGLQLADLMAGAMARCLKWHIQDKKNGDDYAKELFDFMPEAFGGHMLWPSPDVTPEDLGTIGPKLDDPIQHIIDLMRGKKKDGGP